MIPNKIGNQKLSKWYKIRFPRGILMKRILGKKQTFESNEIQNSIKICNGY